MFVLEQATKIVRTVFHSFILDLIDYYLADAGQSMVPYFDATDITFDEKSALGGIGFMHHSSSMDYAGYIRPLIYSLHYNYLDLFFDEEDDYES